MYIYIIIIINQLGAYVELCDDVDQEVALVGAGNGVEQVLVLESAPAIWQGAFFEVSYAQCFQKSRKILQNGTIRHYQILFRYLGLTEMSYAQFFLTKLKGGSSRLKARIRLQVRFGLLSLYYFSSIARRSLYWSVRLRFGRARLLTPILARYYRFCTPPPSVEVILDFEVLEVESGEMSFLRFRDRINPARSDIDNNLSTHTARTRTCTCTHTHIYIYINEGVEQVFVLERARFLGMVRIYKDLFTHTARTRACTHTHTCI